VELEFRELHAGSTSNLSGKRSVNRKQLTGKGVRLVRLWCNQAPTGLLGKYTYQGRASGR
jgi:hypothetical protein